MNIASQYIVNLIKKNAPAFDSISFITFYVDENGKRVWDEEDANKLKQTKKQNIALKKCFIFSVAHHGIKVWLRENRDNSFVFEYPWQKCGTFTIQVDDLLKASFDSFADAMFIQMMLALQNGKDIYLGPDKILDKHTEYKVLLTADLLNEMTT